MIYTPAVLDASKHHRPLFSFSFFLLLLLLLLRHLPVESWRKKHDEKERERGREGDTQTSRQKGKNVYIIVLLFSLFIFYIIIAVSTEAICRWWVSHQKDWMRGEEKEGEAIVCLVMVPEDETEDEENENGEWRLVSRQCRNEERRNNPAHLSCHVSATMYKQFYSCEVMCRWWYWENRVADIGLSSQLRILGLAKNSERARRRERERKRENSTSWSSPTRKKNRRKENMSEHWFRPSIEQSLSSRLSSLIYVNLSPLSRCPFVRIDRINLGKGEEKSHCKRLRSLSVSDVVHLSSAFLCRRKNTLE